MGIGIFGFSGVYRKGLRLRLLGVRIEEIKSGDGGGGEYEEVGDFIMGGVVRNI